MILHLLNDLSLLLPPVPSMWCTLHGSVFNLILLLLLACHAKAVFSDPGQHLFTLQAHKPIQKITQDHCWKCWIVCNFSGMVPLPDTALDFSDLRSQSSRMNERVRHINHLACTFSTQLLSIVKCSSTFQNKSLNKKHSLFWLQQVY